MILKDFYWMLLSILCAKKHDHHVPCCYQSYVQNNIMGTNIYIFTCIYFSGLLSNKEPDRLEACLKVLPKLVKQEPGDLKHVRF